MKKKQKISPKTPVKPAPRRLPSWIWQVALVLLCAGAVWAFVHFRNANSTDVSSTSDSSENTDSVSAKAPTKPNSSSPPEEAPEGMVWIPGGEFSMGCDDPRSQPHGGPDGMADARPIHRVYVDGFWMDNTEV